VNQQLYPRIYGDGGTATINAVAVGELSTYTVTEVPVNCSSRLNDDKFIVVLGAGVYTVL
jgi:hypothetical protein